MRILRSISKRAKNLLHPKKKLFFLHIAKCGGISINRALRYRYLGGYERLNARASVDAAVNLNRLQSPFDDDYESVLKLREQLLLYFLHEGHPFISGHYGYSDAAYKRFAEEYAFMTILRDPIDRFFSSYFFNWKKEDDSPWKIKQGLEEFVESRQALALGRDYVRLLGGVRGEQDYDSDAAIEHAKRNIKKFDIVGTIEDTERITDSIKTVLGVRIRLGHKNRNPISSSKRNRAISDSVRKSVIAICRPNREVYDALVSLKNDN